MWLENFMSGVCDSVKVWHEKICINSQSESFSRNDSSKQSDS